MDTMSLHIAICGLTNMQRVLYQAAKNDSQLKVVREYKQRHQARGAVIVRIYDLVCLEREQSLYIVCLIVCM